MRAAVEGIDQCGWSVVGVILFLVALEAGGRVPPLYQRAMGWTAVLTLLLVGGFGCTATYPQDTATVFGLLILTWNASCAAALASLVVLPVVNFFVDGWRQAIANRRAEVARWKADRERARLSALPTPPPPPPPSPPPTTDERAEQLRLAFEENCRRVDASALPDDEKTALKNAQLDEYQRRLRELLG